MNCAHQKPAVDNFDQLNMFLSMSQSAGSVVMMDVAVCCPEPAKDLWGLSLNQILLRAIFVILG